MSDRKMEDLNSIAGAKLQQFLSFAAVAEIDVLVTCTYRTVAEQDAIYAQGRTTPGRIVTNAKGGDSFHNYRCAVDVVVLRNGKPLWEVFCADGTMEPEWKKLGEIAAANGVEWAGTWEHFKEYAHFQYTGGLSLEEFKSGKEIQQ